MGLLYYLDAIFTIVMYDIYMYVSIIIPAYKKENTIGENMQQIYDTMQSTRYDFELIIVVDGFLDKTYENAIAYLNNNPHLKNKIQIHGYKTNKGKGYAVRYGMARSTGEYIAFIDAGMEINPNGISMIMEHMQWYNADIIVASKRHPVSITKYPPMRRLYSWGYYLMARILFGFRVSDTQTGLKIYKRKVLKDVLPRLLVKDFAFDVELLAVANRLGYTRIFDAPVDVELNFSDSKFSKHKFLFLDPFIRLMLIDTLAIFYRLKILRYYDDDSYRRWEYDEELMLPRNTGDFILRNKKTQKANYINPGDIKFSIIIPVRGINDFLRESIEYIKELNYKNFEVLILTDNEEEYRFNDKRFKIIPTGSISPGEKRNIGAKYSYGEVLAFLDDDAFPSQDWLTEAANLFEDPSVYALGAPAVTPKNASTLERCSGRVLESFLASGNTVYRHIPKHQRLIDDYPSVNLLVRKDSFVAVGGFTKEFWPGEDTKLCLDLIKHHKRKFLYDPRPIVYHHRRTLFTPHLKQISRYGKHRGQFAVQFPENSRSISYFIPSFFVIGLILGPILATLLPFLWPVYFYSVLIYLGMLVYSFTQNWMQDKSLFSATLVVLGIISTHLVYGTNFIIGLLKKPELQLKGFDVKSGNYIEG